MVGLVSVLVLLLCIIVTSVGISGLSSVLIRVGWMVIGCFVLFAKLVFSLRGGRFYVD